MLNDFVNYPFFIKLVMFSTDGEPQRSWPVVMSSQLLPLTEGHSVLVYKELHGTSSTLRCKTLTFHPNHKNVIHSREN